MNRKKYLPFPLFLLILTLIGGGTYYFLQKYPVAHPIGINEVAASLPTEAIAACEGKDLNSACSYHYCPPMPKCPEGRMCIQQMPPCVDRKGICQTQGCSVVVATITLEASPAPIKTFLNHPFELDLNAKSIQDKLTGVELKLNFDPSSLEIKAIQPTEYLPVVLSNAIFGSGLFTTALTVPPDSGGRSDWGTFSKITVKPLLLGEHQITFDNTIVSTLNSDKNGLLSSTPIAITVYNPGDLNYSKNIDLFDYNLLLAGYGTTYTLYDYNDLVANYGKTSP